ncbi:MULTISPECIES: hypothetical protein [Rhizobium]|uniref:Uncharacterized protein n=1 Tax=Rhizobium paranaense TaxID=1650438 RepID=A0A7W8XSW9_9HYPH|nr:hypothetical protein [Rhizobium paranaense]MBB5574992.1 hypothetical protein [Rhizobium paranaense]
MTAQKPITLQEARGIAADEARRIIGEFLPKSGISSILEDEYVENDDCWIFFRNRQINVPVPNRTIVAHWSFAVSRFGEYLTVPDNYGDAAAISAQLEKLSAYYKSHDFP